MTFGAELSPRRRFPAFAASLVLHGTAISLLALRPISFYVTVPGSQNRERPSVRLLRWETPAFTARLSPDAAPPASAPAERAAPQSQEPDPGSAAPVREPIRRFDVPSVRNEPVEQTLVQFDVPLNVVLKHEVPVPTMLWAVKLPSPPSKELEAPPAKPAPKPDQQVPEAPILERPNQEANIATQKIATAPPKENALISRAPATTSPVAQPGSQMAVEIPQITPSEGSQTAIPGLISASDLMMRSSVIALPPANQIAPARAESTVGSGSGSAASPQPDGKAHVAQGSAGKEAAAGSAADANQEVPGTKRIVRPKDGRFAAVVVGSEASSPYEDQPNPLRGQVIYTVHVDVGLRKKWILQYSVLTGAETPGSSAPPDAPWPVVLVVPNALDTPDIDYVMLHGKMTLEGKFDGLALTYPTEFEHKDVLLKALREWEFRPARRDGANVGLGVVLIVPRQPE